MEIAKKKVFYTTFAALILSSFTLQTGKADEVQVKSDEAKIVELLEKELKKDRAKTQIVGFTPLHLLEMTRKHLCSN